MNDSRLLAVSLAVFLSATAAPTESQVMARKGMVVATHPLAAQAGLDVLKDGGNAFDAAVATAATLAVVEPLMSGLGGVGGYALIYDAEKKEVRSLDFIGAAPAAASPEALASGARLWDRAHPARDSFMAPLVPGNVAGWRALLETYGTKTWPEVLATAIDYAENGYVVTPSVARGFADGGFGGAVGRYPYGAGIWFAGGAAPKPGQVIVQEDLARTLRTIASEGPTAYYGGSIASAFVDFFRDNGGILTIEDFEAYEARWQDPLSITYRGNTLYSQPPGGSGMTVLQSLKILEHFDLGSLDDNSPELIHLISEAMKLAFVDEDRHNSGKAGVDIPLDRLLSDEYASEQAARVNRETASFYPQARADSVTDAVEHTTHHTVVDVDGNVVSITQTLMLPAGVVVPGTGVIFNNGMSYFSLDPDDVNVIEGGKRPRFVMSPTIVTKGDEPWLALGSAGGWTIPQTIVQVLVRAIDLEMDAHDAVTAPRFVMRYLDNSIPYMKGTDLVLEKDLAASSRKTALEQKGHRLRQPVTRLGMLNAIKIDIDSGVLSGGADPRREGHVAAW